MATTATDRIEKRVVLRAPRARVWRALASADEFGTWFGATLQSPFEEGATVRGRSTYPGYEHIPMNLMIERIEPETYLAFRWHPHAMDPNVDYSNDPTTLVEFRLEEAAEGTVLTITESGFDKIPLEHRAESFRRNDGGWTEQARNIERHVSAS